MLGYKMICILTTENARCHGKPLHEAILQYVRGLKTCARCSVMRGVAGAYESGEVATNKIEVLSYNMPIQVQIVLPAAEAEAILPKLSEIVEEGILSVQDLPVVCHKTRNVLLPPHLCVRDAMTHNPKSVSAQESASAVARLLLSADFHATPVVDGEGRPIGIITQGDLIERAGMPVRLGLMQELGHPGLSSALNALGTKPAAQIMSQPATTITESEPLVDAVRTMLAKGFKRLPVVDAAGKLVGVLSRFDIFHTISREAPDWGAIRGQNVTVHDFRLVRDVMQRETHTVLPDATVDEVLLGLGGHDVQRIGVVDKTGKFMGLIADRDLLRAFSEDRSGVWAYMASVLGGKRTLPGSEALRKVSAATIMKTDVVTVHDDAPLDQAIRTMTRLKIKRLPVVDGEGRFKGMVSRDAILRAGLGTV